ncbi:hypothetical protein BT020_08260 [Campylobacter upsaliensis]|nr:hypothetical protein [Campylobacter upsaliensis]EAJ8785130.1 hypothetical protein [Campylobacter upsaliensis]
MGGIAFASCEGKASRIKRAAISKGGSLEREFIKQGKANSPEATRQIYAKWQGKFKPNLAKPKKLFLKAKSQKIGAKRYIGAKLNLVS